MILVLSSKKIWEDIEEAKILEMFSFIELDTIRQQIEAAREVDDSFDEWYITDLMGRVMYHYRCRHDVENGIKVNFNGLEFTSSDEIFG